MVSFYPYCRFGSNGDRVKSVSKKRRFMVSGLCNNVSGSVGSNGDQRSDGVKGAGMCWRLASNKKAANHQQSNSEHWQIDAHGKPDDSWPTGMLYDHHVNGHWVSTQ